jgi:hypothetical protein
MIATIKSLDQQGSYLFSLYNGKSSPTSSAGTLSYFLTGFREGFLSLLLV